MARVLTNNKNYYDIADTIRQMKNVNTTYKPRQMASALKDIYSNEAEGTLPLSFESNGMPLIDYRIDGANGGVGDRTGNLLQNTATTQTVNGVTFTVNEDGSVTCNTDENGATGDTRFYLLGISGADFKRIECDTAIKLTGCPSGGSSSTYYIALLRQNDSTYPSYNSYADFGNGFVPSYDATNKYVIYIQIKSGQVCTDLTFYPMIRKADIEDNTYEPYGYKVPVKIEGKNLANWDKKWTVSTNGTVISDQHTISCIIDVRNINNIYIYGDTTKLNSGIYRIGKSDTPIQIGTQTNRSQTQNNGVINVSDCNYIIIACGVYSTSTTFDDIKNSFMIVEGTTSPDNFEPYHEPTTTNIYLDEPIEARANIPNEYEEVEYLESTGTQYIDTGINVNTTTSRYETKINPSSVSGTMGVFGTRNNSMASQSSMNVFIISGTFRLDWVSGNGDYNVKNISSNTDYTISITRGLATINNVNYTSGETTSIDSLYPFCVGNFNNIGSVFSTGFSGKIYYSKLYNNNILVFDGVPCYRKSDNEIGMYDLVSNTFFTNAGTGNFIVGPIKENESISLSDTNVDIPTIDGTNVLTIDTTIQPSNVYVQAPKDTDEIIYLTTILEEGI